MLHPFVRPTARARVVAGALGLLVLGLAADPASAQFGLRGVTDQPAAKFHPFSGQVLVVKKFAAPRTGRLTLTRFNVRPAIDNGWARAVGPLQKLLVQELGKGGRFQGQTAHDIRLTLANRGRLYALPTGNWVKLRYKVPGNSLRFKLTTPDIAFGIGFGSYADPGFAVDFDLTIDILVSLNEEKGPRALAPTVRVKTGRPRGTNVTGTLAVALNDVVHFLGGPDVIGRARAQINGQQVNLPAQLTQSFSPMTKASRNLRLPGGVGIRPSMEGSRVVLELYELTWQGLR